MHGAVKKGRFIGTIKTSEDIYHVEPAIRHFKNPRSFHSVIYKATDVHANYNHVDDSARVKGRPTSFKVKSEAGSKEPDITRCV